MKNYLLHLDSKLLRIVREVGIEAGRKRLSVYVVGGVVRDILLKRTNFDLDIVVEGNAISLARTLAKKWKAPLTVYRQFGTASLELLKGIRIDLVTARKETYAQSGALPVVKPGNLKQDLFRRDFTVNAMAIAINPERFGHLVDEFGGLRDLKKKKIRVLHSKSFIDDPTRILRAVRFEQRFHFQIERQTRLLINEALRKKVVSNVKPPRYFAEFKKILCELDPLRCLKRLHRMGGLQFLDSKLEVRFQNLRFIHVRIQRARKKQLYRQHAGWWLVYFMGLIAKADGRVRGNILAKFQFTKSEQKGIRQSQEAGDVIKKLSVRCHSPSRIYQILKPLTEDVVLYMLVRTSSALVGRRIDRFLTKDIHVKLQITGEDLKEIGINPGREMGKVLDDVLCLKIDQRIHTKKEELKAALLSSGK